MYCIRVSTDQIEDPKHQKGAEHGAEAHAQQECRREHKHYDVPHDAIDREHNQFKDLVPINCHYNGTLRIVMGKGLSYFMVYSLVAVYILCVVPRLFSLNQIAIPGVLTLFTLPYLTACIFFAMTASIAIRNREIMMQMKLFSCTFVIW